jgi:hypothetical protein
MNIPSPSSTMTSPTPTDSDAITKELNPTLLQSGKNFAPSRSTTSVMILLPERKTHDTPTHAVYMNAKNTTVIPHANENNILPRNPYHYRQFQKHTQIYRE